MINHKNQKKEDVATASKDFKIDDPDKQDVKQISIIDILKKIGDLRNNGTLTNEEFLKLKSKILANVEDNELLISRSNADHSNISLPPESAQSGDYDSVKAAISTANNFLTYHNYSLDFKIKFPSHWTREKDNVSSTFYSPITKSNSRASLAIERWTTTKNVPFEDYKNEKINSLENKYKESLKYILQESSPLTLGGIQSWKAEYTLSPPDEKNIQKMEIWMITKGFEYHISYTAYEDDYPLFLKTIQTMLNSFELLEDNFLLYENTDHGLKIKYPPDWEGLELNQREDDSRGTRIVQFAASTKEYREFIPTVCIDVRKLSSPIPAEVIVQDIVFNDKKKYRTFELIEISSINLSGNPGKKLVSKAENQYLLRVFATTGNAIYIISYADDIKKFNQTLPTVQKMIDSFEATAQKTTSYDTGIATDLSTYESRSLGIRIRYPLDWIADEKQYDSRDERHAQVVGFLSPFQNNYVERVGIYIRYMKDQSQLLDEFVNYYLDSIRAKSQKGELTLLELNPIILVGYSAYKIVYKLKSLIGNEMKMSEYVIISYGKSYIIAYGAELEKYAEYLPVVEKMVTSFEIMK